MGLRNQTDDAETSSTCHQDYLKLKNMEGEVYVTLTMSGATQITFLGRTSYATSHLEMLTASLFPHTVCHGTAFPHTSAQAYPRQIRC